MELDFKQALAEAEKLVGDSHYHLALRDCALLHYAMAQCYRKLGKGCYLQAKSLYAETTRQLTDWTTNGNCPCGVNCSRCGLFAEVHRGRAALHRVNGEFEKAAMEFAKGLKHLKQEAHAGIKADFNFSYGYLHFEVAVRKLIKAGSWTPLVAEVQGELMKAKKLFNQAHDDHQSWSAPLARLAMCEQLLSKSSDVYIDHYLSAYFKATREPGNVESSLTGINCRFAVLLDDHFKEAPEERDFTPESVLADLLRLFSGPNRIVAGPRECHAFDNLAILQGKGAKLPKGSSLANVRDFFELAAKAQLRTLEEQHGVVQKFCTERSIPLPSASGGYPKRAKGSV
jgi:tetratricopeptide (TPR) repeat protein